MTEPMVIVKRRAAKNTPWKAAYPWGRLKVAGDKFVWRDMAKYDSLRVQAVRQGSLLGCTISVRKTGKTITVTRL